MALIIPTLLSSRPVSNNRIFQDEINAAGALDLGDPQSPFFTWPERLGEQPEAAMIAALPQAVSTRLAATNRFFLDEIAGAKTRNDDATISTLNEVTQQLGPR